MSPGTARTTANLLMAAAAGAIVYAVARTPPLRRAAWRAIRMGLTVTVPGYLAHEVREAWSASGGRP
jgi:hypothetical protein